MPMPLNPFEQVIFDHPLHIETVENDDSGAVDGYQLICGCTFDSYETAATRDPTDKLRRAHAQHVWGQLRQLFTGTWG